MQPFWRDPYNLTRAQFPESTRAFESTVSLPLYTRMTEADQIRVIRAVRGLLSADKRKACSQEAADVVQTCH
ncbi:MAG: DegT/DnrJ/EryC1/StrS family aminotransferase [Bryobacteraceae bacterium]